MSASRSPAEPRSREAVAAALAEVLLTPADAAVLEVHGRTHAAVLVPLFLGADGALHVVLTRRRDDLRRHAGEISVPGGRHDPEDVDLRATALREAHEEIGLPPHAVELVGALQPTPTIATDYAVHPFVGLIEPGFAWTVSQDEVAEVLELPLAVLRAGATRRAMTRRGVPFRTDVYVFGGDDDAGALVWGATARMLGDLFDRLPPELG